MTFIEGYLSWGCQIYKRKEKLVILGSA
ncbi:MAG: hypothetical protein ACD_69C00067G0001, partial [uncultured bacterium]